MRLLPWAVAGLQGLTSAAASFQAHAQSPRQAPATTFPIADCRAIDDDRQRLACFDRASGRDASPSSGAPSSPPAQPGPPPLSSPPQAPSLPDLSAPDGATQPPGSLQSNGSDLLAQPQLDVRRSLGATLAERWELEPSLDRGRFLLRAYKPMYVLMADWTSRPNEMPRSPNPQNTVLQPLDLRRTEAKFQISLKTKVWKGLIGDRGDLWMGYTQSSYWQVYNRPQSRPFRETDYEPEVMAVFPTDYSLLGWNGRLAGLGLNHQSNGRERPLSRSWDRLIAQFGFERGNWMVMVRPWWRVLEREGNNDNPDIEDYMGRADLLVVRKSEGHELAFTARHSLRSGSRSHGALQIEYAFPITGYLKAYAQVFTGYGVSLIDYNHRQTRLGIGISLVQWL